MITNHAKQGIAISFIFVFLISSCTKGFQMFQDGHEKFYIEDSCIKLNNETTQSISFPGVIWFDENNFASYKGRFGLHWIDSKEKNNSIISVDPISMIVSPDGKNAVFNGYKLDVQQSKFYLLKEFDYEEANIKRLYNSPVWKDDTSLLGTDWDTEKRTITVITTDLTTGTVQENTVRDSSMSTEPAPKIASNGILTYIWYQNYEGPRLVVYDTKTNREIARYKDINYQIRPSWHGYLLNPQGTHILSISSLTGEGYDGWQQELFGVEIGKEPVQITNFHSKYPYALIYDINFGGQNWSPDSRWVVLNVLTSETKRINSSVNPSWLFIIDLENNVGYQICQQINPKDQHSITWSPDSKYFALSINDKIWVVDPKTLESRLLVEKTDIPLQVLGWTVP